MEFFFPELGWTYSPSFIGIVNLATDITATINEGAKALTFNKKK